MQMAERNFSLDFFACELKKKKKVQLLFIFEMGYLLFQLRHPKWKPHSKGSYEMYGSGCDRGMPIIELSQYEYW